MFIFFRKNRALLFVVIFIIGLSLVFTSIIQLNNLFVRKDFVDAYSYVAEIPFPAMITLIGGIIFLTLAYVGWRKYIGEKRKRRDKIN